MSTSLTNDALALLRDRGSIHNQARNASTIALPSCPSIEDIPKITWKNKVYVLESHLAKKKGRGHSSWIRHHGVFLVEIIDNSTGPSFWCCRLCDQRGDPRIFAIQSTTSAAEHLMKSHKIPKNSPFATPS
ncbi:hypothetical protein LZ30DRAFT_609873, partial [Colletotrichum cereale]